MIYGTTRVWWQLEPDFNDPGPYVFQLQVGGTGLAEADDWRDILAPIVNGYSAYDNKRHDAGSVITAHYRVTLTTGAGKYVSSPSPSTGELADNEWVLAREILRKETLRHRKVSIGGFLIKAFRYGAPCPRCRDKLTEESSDIDCPVCYGTSYENGYHPAAPLQCWDITPGMLEQEESDDQLVGTTRRNALITARVIGFPALNSRDVWVNGSSDERWLVRAIKIAASMRGVPLVYEVQMELLPLTNIIYQLPLTSAESGPVTTPPGVGNGCVSVGTNYAGLDLRYLTANNVPIVNARVYAFLKSVYDRAYPDHPPRHRAVASTTTNSLGGLTANLQLDPGDYVLLYEKLNDYGPDTKPLQVVKIIGSSSSSMSSTSSTAGFRRVDTFWDI